MRKTRTQNARPSAIKLILLIVFPNAAEIKHTKANNNKIMLMVSIGIFIVSPIEVDHMSENPYQRWRGT